MKVWYDQLEAIRRTGGTGEAGYHPKVATAIARDLETFASLAFNATSKYSTRLGALIRKGVSDGSTK